MRQAENKCKIEGILSEINLRDIEYSRNGAKQNAIAGNIIVKVNQMISGTEKELFVPVHMFAAQLTQKGTQNPAFESARKVKEEFVSIAACGDEELADRVRITGGQITVNEYFNADGRLQSYPRIRASFVNKIKKAECHPEASFAVEFSIAAMTEEVGIDGEPTGATIVKAIIPQYGEKVDVVNFRAETPKVIEGISSIWSINDTVKANGKIDFSSETRITMREVDFGEPVEEAHTVQRSNLVITGGTEPLDPEFGFSHDEVQKALTERKMRLEEQKKRDMNRAPKQKAAPAPSTEGFADLGF